MKLIKPTTCLQWFNLYILYKKAFPSYERKPFSLIFNTFIKNQCDVWSIEDHDQFVGLAITLNFKDLVLLDYFAIEEGLRGLGYGTKVISLLKQKYNTKRLFIEIESTLECCDNLSERKQRKNFYLKNGMKELNTLANVFGTNMELLSYSTNITFEDYYSIYFNIYGKQSADHLIKLEYPEVQQ